MIAYLESLLFTGSNMGMKIILFLASLFPAFQSFGQSIVTLDMPPLETSDTVTIITKFDIDKATKDGYYIEGYVVTIDPSQAKQFHGRNVKIKGVVTIMRGLAIEPTLYDKDGNILASQGRKEETKHILHPAIEILK